MGKWLLIAWAFCTACFIGLVMSSAAGAAATWLPPMTLSPAGQEVDDARIAVDPAGNVIVVWSRWNGTQDIVQAAVRRSGGPWGATRDLTASNRSAESQNVAFDLHGNAIVVWRRSNGSNYVVQARRRTAGGIWRATQTISNPRPIPGRHAYDPEIAIDRFGNATAVWGRSNGANSIIQAARLPAGGRRWSAPRNLSIAGQDADSPHVGVDASGTATVAWRRSNGTHLIVQAARRPAHGGWSAPRRLSALGQHAEDVALAVSTNGVAMVVWSRPNGIDLVVQAARRPARGPWAAPRTLSAAGGHADSADVALDKAGNGIVVWERSVGAVRTVQAAVRFGTTWLAPQDISPPGGNPQDPQVALNPSGKAVAVWARSNGANTIIQAAVRPSSGPWGAGGDVSGPGADASRPQVGVDSAGNAAAAWQRANGADIVTQAAGYDAAGPVLAGRLPRSGTVSMPVSFSVASTDVWSVPLLPSWTFGDGGVATGPDVEHTYAATGAFPVTVSQSDALGNATTRNLTIRIRKPCLVPRVVGKRLAAAKRALVGAHCRLGPVRRSRSSSVEEGRVVSQSPRAGRKLENGASVRLVVSLGPG